MQIRLRRRDNAIGKHDGKSRRPPLSCPPPVSVSHHVVAPRMVCLHGGGDSLFPAFISPKWRRLSSFPGLAEASSFAPLTPGRSKKSDGGASKDLVRRLQLSLTSCDWNENTLVYCRRNSATCHIKPFEVDDRPTPLRPETRPAVRSHGFSGAGGAVISARENLDKC